MQNHEVLDDLLKIHTVNFYLMKLDPILLGKRALSLSLRQWIIQNCKTSHFPLKPNAILQHSLPDSVENFCFVVDGVETPHPPLQENGLPAVECLLYCKTGIPYLYRYIP